MPGERQWPTAHFPRRTRLPSLNPDAFQVFGQNIGKFGVGYAVFRYSDGGGDFAGNLAARRLDHMHRSRDA